MESLFTTSRRYFQPAVLLVLFFTAADISHASILHVAERKNDTYPESAQARLVAGDIPALLIAHWPDEFKIQETLSDDYFQHAFPNGFPDSRTLDIIGDEKKTDRSSDITGTLESKADIGIIKCLTPWVRLYGEMSEHLDPAIRQKILDILHYDAQEAEHYESESGRFRISFHREGDHAVPAADENESGIPDYVERAAGYADYSWEVQVADLGFEDPITGEPLVISIRNIGSQTYGYTIRDGSTTRIVVHHNFLDFPPNDDPEGNQPGALKVTIAHELKHSIQFATNQWKGDAGSVDWVEMDATMMENIVYPQVNDYYNYIGGTHGIFGNPRQSTPVAYSHVTWSLFYAEHLGMSYWVDVWREIKDIPLIPMVQAMKQALPVDPAHRTDEFREQLTRNHLWHATSGARTPAGYGFSESDAYPNAIMDKRHDPVPENYETTDTLTTLSGAYRMFYPDVGQIGAISLSAEHDHDGFGLGILGYRRDGTVAEWVVPVDDGGFTQARSRFSAVDLDSFLVVAVNAHPGEDVSYAMGLHIERIPDVVTLEPNYPNPFSASSGNPGTTITFSVPESEQVTISVYDVTGRKVAQIYDERVDPGRYDVPFEANGLASGVYLYRLQAGSVQKTGKMTILR